MLKVKALLFDVFGTVVDWRTGIAREVESIAKKNDISLDPFDFADAWRAEYQPAMEEIRKGRRSFTCLLYTSPSPRDRQKSRMPSSAWKKK